MNTRAHFLKALFRSLEAGGIAYCVLRNHEGLFQSATTADVDLLIEENDLAKFSENLQSAASKSGLRFVHHARYVNHSCVFWSSQSNFIRIDFDTEIRWRLFPILSARTILDARQKQDGVYIPHPRHESVVLFSQAMWTGCLEQRYCRRLAQLHDFCDKGDLRRTYREAFGNQGDSLAELHAHVIDREFTKALCSALKRSVIRKTIAHSRSWLSFARNFVGDVRRFWQRLRRPAGISLLYVTSLHTEKNLDAFMSQIEFLFPAQKCFVYTVDLSEGGGERTGWGMRLEIRRLRSLFKGGLCVQFYRLAKDADALRVTRAGLHRLYSSRCFICSEDSTGRTCLTHVGSGFRSCDSETSMNTDLCALLIAFISTVLEKENRRGLSEDKLIRAAF